MINTIKLKNINAEVRKYKKYKAPQPNNVLLPKLWFSLMSASPKGSGKTYNIVQLLTAYEESGFTYDGEPAEMRIVWMSGNTIHSKQNAIIKTLKTLDEKDMYEITDKNIDKFQEVYDELLNEKQEIERYNEYRDIYNKFIKGDINKLTDVELLELEDRDFINPDNDPDAPKWKVPRIVFMVFDDLIGNSMVFGYKKNNWVNKIIVKHRHDAPNLVPINLLMISQSFKAIPTIIRKNTDIFVLLKNANRKKIIEAVSDEVGSILSVEQFTRYYDYTSSIEHGALIISCHKDEKKELRIRMGWDTALQLPVERCKCISEGKPFGSCGKKE
jgi:predicted oxidoreductase (fatty acid repression mutant protein)